MNVANAYLYPPWRDYNHIIAAGKTISLVLNLTLKEPVPVGAQVSLKIMKEGNPDSQIVTNYDGDYLLRLGAETLCPNFVPKGQECKLPLNAGVYGGGLGHPLAVTLPKIPVPIASGAYYADATIILADGTEMVCRFARAQLVDV